MKTIVLKRSDLSMISFENGSLQYMMVRGSAFCGVDSLPHPKVSKEEQENILKQIKDKEEFIVINCE